MILLEMIVGLAILAVAGFALMASVMQASSSLRNAEMQDQKFAQALALLDASSLWTAAQLDQHLGDRRQGEWIESIQHPAAERYDISILDSLQHAVVLSTSVRRPTGDQ